MDPKPEKPLRLFVNPFTLWTDLALKAGEAMLASAHAAAVQAQRPGVAVIPTVDAPPPKPQAPSPDGLPAKKHPPAPTPEPARRAAKPARQASKAARFKAARAKARSKAKSKLR